jgi:hypothetical protein
MVGNMALAQRKVLILAADDFEDMGAPRGALPVSPA